MPCVNNGTCTNQVGFYSCLCQLGYTGGSCQTGVYIFVIDQHEMLKAGATRASNLIKFSRNMYNLTSIRSSMHVFVTDFTYNLE